jgi:glycosyltransferase involved in cell wall biosynthesis
LKKVAVFSKFGRLGASSRQRFYLYENFFNNHGITLEYFPLIDDRALQARYSKGKYSLITLLVNYIKRMILVLRLKKTHSFWIQSELFPFLPSFFELFFLRKTKFVIDMDDAIFHNYDLNKSPIIRILLSKKIDLNIATANHVVCGSPYLYERALQNRCSDISLIPTCIDIDKYQESEFIYNKVKPVIGWIGSPTTARYLNIIEPALIRLNNLIPFDLHVVGGRFKSKMLSVKNLAWSEDKELSLIRNFDIGVMPLEDSQWEEGKCGYKIIQYMGCGIPYVCSNVGVNNSLVKNSNAGFLAINEEEWIASMKDLLSNHKLRMQMGHNGVNAVRDLYSFQSQHEAYAEIFSKLELAR